MSSRRRLAAAAIAGAVVVTPMLAGCGDGQHPQVLLATQFVEGVNASKGAIQLRNVFVLGPAPNATLPRGGSAPLYATINNNSASPDRLIGVDSNGLALRTVGGAIALPANTSAHTFVSTGSQSRSTVIFKGLTAALNGTENVKITFEFADAGNVTLTVPVVPWQEFYSTYAPAPLPTPTSTTTPPSVITGSTGKPKGRGRATPTPSGIAPSPSAS